MPGKEEAVSEWWEKSERIHLHQNDTSQKPFPGIILEKFMAIVKKNGPLITWDWEFPSTKLFLNSDKIISLARKWWSKWIDLRLVWPVHTCWTKKSAGYLMVKTPVNFYVPCNRRNKRFIGRWQPIHNCRLEAFGIVRSRTWCTFLQLARNNKK